MSTVRGLAVLCVLSLVACGEDPSRELRERDASLNARSPFAGKSLYTDPVSMASVQATLWRAIDPDGAAIMDDLATVPLSLWLGDWMDDVEEEVDEAMDDAGDQIRSFVVYNIPDRDCGNFSSGGANDVANYASFVDGIADGLAGREAIVILEPDALALDHCLDDHEESEREGMLSDAVDVLTEAGASVYLDAGDSNWIPADDMADRLLDAGVERAAGFALNVSHTEWSRDENDYAQEIRAIIGEDAHYVIDTGRNGVGPAEDGEWCNPPDRKNGRRPTFDVYKPGLDALLWVKKPGHSDGWCNGGPEAGDWWPEYARALAE